MILVQAQQRCLIKASVFSFNHRRAEQDDRQIHCLSCILYISVDVDAIKQLGLHELESAVADITASQNTNCCTKSQGYL